MDLITLERIKLLHPKVRFEVTEAYKHINAKLLGKNVRLRFSSTLRTIDEQDKLYAQGRTDVFDNRGKRLGIVTNAKGGESIHNYGLAFDIVLLQDKNNDGIFEAASWDIKADNDGDGMSDWLEAATYFKSLGWIWGGDWKAFPDSPHFEKTFGHGWKFLKKKYDEGDVFTEMIDGKIFKWVNL